jgi:hypothetical protein
MGKRKWESDEIDFFPVSLGTPAPVTCLELPSFLKEVIWAEILKLMGISFYSIGTEFGLTPSIGHSEAKIYKPFNRGTFLSVKTTLEAGEKSILIHQSLHCDGKTVASGFTTIVFSKMDGSCANVPSLLAAKF